MPKGKW
ncbi:unnamed protein product, partial [Parascedosporium putredinis]